MIRANSRGLSLENHTSHVIAAQIGQPVMVRNSDGFLHNVHALSIDNPSFNFAQVAAGDKPIPPFTTVETFQIKCDVHPLMQAYIGVFSHPFFATTGPDGKFTISGLDPGTYTITAWQERLGTQTATVTVAANASATANFKFTTPGGK